MLTKSLIQAIEQILKRGNDALIKTSKYGVVVYEEKKKKVYTQPQEGGCKS